jgi:SAM-dependent methyltransferase
MPTFESHLICQLRLPEPDERSPTIRLTGDSNEVIASIPTSESAPHLPLPDQSVRSISALDILEHVHDEQTWLGEFARVLIPDGQLTVRVPLENALAWLDALNIYRYVSDTIDRGEHPKETFPIGWHRHYAPCDLPEVLQLAGFDVTSAKGERLSVGEIPHLAGLIVGNIVRQCPETERELFERRIRSTRDPGFRLPTSIAARITVHATRVREGYDPDPALDESDRPEEETATPLE